MNRPPGWLQAPQVVEVCSVAGCVTTDVVDPQLAWRHNGFGVANDPAVLWGMVEEAGLDPAGSQLFYYEAYEQELESDGWEFDPKEWRPVSPAPSACVATAVSAPDPSQARLIGYDVVVFGDFLEHSPLSCNSIAEALPVNGQCLLDSLDTARAAIDAGAFGGGCEEGVYKIFSVSIVGSDRVDDPYTRLV